MNNRFSTVPSTSFCQTKQENTMPNGRILVFMTGFCLGMVFFYLSDKIFAKESGLLDYARICQLQEFTSHKEGLLQYVMSVRLRQFIFLLLCTTSVFGGILLYTILGWYGFELGILLFTAVYQYGVKGLLFCLLMFFPHGIFYLLIFLICIHKYGESNTKYYHKNVRINQIKTVLLVLLLLSLGILCETYINPGIVHKLSLFF